VVERADARDRHSGVHELGLKFYAKTAQTWVIVWPTNDSDLDEIRSLAR
jgi:hypothetical protein